MKKVKNKKLKDNQIKGSWDPKQITPKIASILGESKSFTWLLSNVKLD